MAEKLFGTDGIRGTANRHPMSAEIALKVGQAAGLHFTRGSHRHRVVIGKDTRLSGYLIEPALTAGFVAAGMDVILVGPMPTPAVAMLTRSLRADLGVMISASHNPFEDNGIKIFGPDGYKLSDEVEEEIENRVAGDMTADLAPPAELGRAYRLDDAIGRYTEYVKQTFPRGMTLEGMKIVIDCANGATYKVAPEVLWELGAEVVTIGTEPDGFNINRDCGSTSTELMSQQVVTHNADIGIALDGDGDRVIICDEKGEIIDGDQLMAVIATSLREKDKLENQTLVATVMSNIGLEKYLGELGIALLRTKVGDRYVVEAMRENNAVIGGEQSGHIILGEYSTTGDGIIAALEVLAVLVESGKKASSVCRPFKPMPQLLENVRFSGTSPLELDDVKSAIVDAEKKISATGRLLIRKSGTEPLIRVMAEGSDEVLVRKVVGELSAHIRKLAG